MAYKIICKGHPEHNKNLLEDTTYGFGIQLPVNKISKSKIPLDIKFDMVRLEQPSYSADWGDFSVYNLSINWQY
ncbi:hypothetical protein AUJ95_04935 [Candidatus Desantisbacteria bacterium CG2_30_40_21]|uniref:Outer membrane protein beta-barrel domain-containing protein n=5 Tax=unclassified Candidatus Desantisiibacteriota TaxID=3106372 RepID=A0A2M7JEI7_9BACT|nr:MAG: hypothetical protein AUJ95_04935 [Candidatus Desantisbacteria bacterium CG2_30_40_21]PIP40265.1 MAG: hypothetical protein COX18_07340 [Candidatus Desantisbacteria bacterium CG23_combo_of_CG06-09_8_20_14_all_40_23]PIX17812.1 MAG: hypothetical protein COZ71_01395 [Candidatus Desantisbacteria bacterium CG_4_8_14_3_um_filter_40_12]PIY20145.1 MAG: hypothetical protein COZ13_01665 [Candidatus Desantisbacteria bacterium CG_4_10_14_3_um_filter_40_18]PJB28367.1 MAG: hypothetical protein CO110_09